MSQRRSTHGVRCTRCKINVKLCFCSELRKLPSKTKISFVMHHREEHLTSNTVNLALMTMENAEIHLRGLPDKPFKVSDLKVDEEKFIPLFLFPEDDAIELNPENLKQLNPKNLPIQLIIPDGTWSQAKKVYRRDFVLLNDTNHRIPAVKLPMGIEGKYLLRKSPRENGLSTFEACAWALEIIENNKELSKELLQMFSIMVERMVKTRRNFHGKETLLTNTYKNETNE